MAAIEKHRMLLAGLAVIALASGAWAQTLTVEESIVVDYRPVIARIEAGDTATGRSRLQGVVTQLNAVEGQIVKAGDVVAVVTDEMITPQLSGLTSRIEGLKSQLRQSEDDLTRNEGLLARGFYPKVRLDEERTALDVLRRTLASAEAERRALSAREGEGRILAPADAHVTDVNVVKGSVVSPGDVLVSFSTVNGVVRLALPERHAATLVEGETISLRLPSRSNDIRTATIMRIYPELRQGSVIADATVQGGLTALFGERVDVLAPVGERRAVRIPKDYVSTRFGVDFVRVAVGDRFIDAPVALAAPLVDDQGQYEILSGLKPGDKIQKPE
ncbi:efflux transporter, RND family, MFP subunit [Hyphomonas neptunium ATCC 15444]|uniref:Efflux transporter, RND family, MFP subunit n=3 Tax=Hyphomonas TaxID=85 RepID=Q0BZG9_HYPNA|nr:efflux RND transporter periplasmic adaptor subunit [Hyphomonas hirschiana]ABI77769.1 efflux transporter, RND family, MFP subunit [Hyphomonas neptunium ATCC 15444]KCZ95213.1 RND family efflux transporter MFP subunit [Hyphomonas hirschiana VP5]